MILNDYEPKLFYCTGYILKIHMKIFCACVQAKYKSKTKD